MTPVTFPGHNPPNVDFDSRQRNNQQNVCASGQKMKIRGSAIPRWLLLWLVPIVLPLFLSPNGARAETGVPFLVKDVDPTTRNSSLNAAIGALGRLFVGINDPASSSKLELGDLVKTIVTVTKKDDALWLPPQAIRTFEGRKFVVIKEGAGQRRVDVKTGIESQDRVEILDGLTAGQQVLGQ